MAGQISLGPARRFVLALACIFFMFLITHLLPAALKGAPKQRTTLMPHRLGGQWKEIRASLRLPPLEDVAYFPSDPDAPLVPHTNRMSRFDLKRKRSMENIAQKSRLPQLHFAADVHENPGVPLQALAASFRAIALTEKSIPGQGQTKLRAENHEKLQRGQRRPVSWRPRPRKPPLKKR